MDKALAEAVLESELEFGQVPQLDPAKQREQDIIAEVARRRKEMEATATKKKSDEIFEHFDGKPTTKHLQGWHCWPSLLTAISFNFVHCSADRDGYMNFQELRELGRATGGDLPRPAYVSICEEIGADPSKGVTKALLLLMYTDAGLGDAHRDYNLIFQA